MGPAIPDIRVGSLGPPKDLACLLPGPSSVPRVHIPPNPSSTRVGPRGVVTAGPQRYHKLVHYQSLEMQEDLLIGSPRLVDPVPMVSALTHGMWGESKYVWVKQDRIEQD